MGKGWQGGRNGSQGARPGRRKESARVGQSARYRCGSRERHAERPGCASAADAHAYRDAQVEILPGLRHCQLSDIAPVSRPASRPMIRWTRLLLRLLLAGVFVYAAWTKLRQPWLVFALSIDAYQLLPEWGVLAIARVLPWLELA